MIKLRDLLESSVTGTNSGTESYGGFKGFIKPEKTKDGKKLEYKPDMQTMKLFEERDYMDALSYIGVLPE